MDWRTQRSLPFQWKGSTNFEEKEPYKETLDTSKDEQRPQQALSSLAEGIKTPAQPTPQERAEHELTHLPYRNWHTTCVQSKGRQDHHRTQQSKQPVIQCDFVYIKGNQDKTVVPIFIAIDVQTGMGLAVYVHDKVQPMQYMQKCLQNLLWDCGRNKAILNSTVLQSDQQDLLITVLKATARALGGNNAIIGARHPITPRVVRHAAYLLGKDAVHTDGQTSDFRRWNNEHETPLCEFGETAHDRRCAITQPA